MLSIFRIFAPPTTAGGGKQGRASGAIPMETLAATLVDVDDGAQGPNDEADAAGGSLKAAGKAAHKSGAQKRALKRKSFDRCVDLAALGGEDSEDEDDKLETVKAKMCDLCGMKNTEQDPVALSLAATQGPNKMRSTPLRWEKAAGRGACCYYCARVHERRYGAKTRKQLKDFLKEGKDDDAALSNQEVFDTERARAVEIFAAGSQRLPSGFCTMHVEPPTQKVEQKKRKIESKKRRGKYIKMDVFQRMFPDKDPKKAGKVSERADASGRVSQWIKVYSPL